MVGDRRQRDKPFHGDLEVEDNLLLDREAGKIAGGFGFIDAAEKDGALAGVEIVRSKAEGL